MATEGGPAGGDRGNKTGPSVPRKKSQKRQRSAQIKTPVTPAEKAEAVALAADAGMTVGAWSRTKLLGTPGPRAQRRMPADTKALRQILGHLGRIGNNINQIAYQLNTGGPADLPELRLALKEYAALRNSIYQALGLEPAPEPPPEKPGGAPRK